MVSDRRRGRMAISDVLKAKKSIRVRLTGLSRTAASAGSRAASRRDVWARRPRGWGVRKMPGDF